ncbi:hypothetical protein [Paraburkholderia sp. SIMBA_054]
MGVIVGSFVLGIAVTLVTGDYRREHLLDMLRLTRIGSVERKRIVPAGRFQCDVKRQGRTSVRVSLSSDRGDRLAGTTVA